MTEFYILSFDKQRKDPELCFWRANAHGYTTTVTEAGKYTLSEVLLNKHHDGPNAIALPVTSLPLITSKLKAFWEMPTRLMVQVIPVKEAKGLLLGNQQRGAVLVGFNPIAQEFRFTKLERLMPVQEQEPLEKDRL
ncbi:MAG TPA: hypothetical protein PLB89_05135 [Flavobacteriales bacterium]|nr:hypothetical protein [Flavobacteriales bacterium]